ncbi:unnamed protein product [Malus baccata var. baccata]
MSDQVAVTLEEGRSGNSERSGFWHSPEIVQLTQKVIAEVIGTYFVIFIGCGSVAVNKIYGSVTFPGICFTWGLIVMVPLYIAAHVLGSILASGTLCLVLDVPQTAYFGTIPVGPNIRSLLMEIIASPQTAELLIGELAGIAVGMTITIDVFVAGPISGASMNPARSLGPAIVMHTYKGIWIYFVGPFIGTILGGFVYNLIRFTDKPLKELTDKPVLRELSKSASFFKSVSKNNSNRT